MGARTLFVPSVPPRQWERGCGPARPQREIMGPRGGPFYFGNSRKSQFGTPGLAAGRQEECGIE